MSSQNSQYTSRAERIEDILTQALHPESLTLVNDSHKHASHAAHIGSAAKTGETHYKLKIVALAFKDLSRVDRQRKVYDLLSQEFKSGLHALELKTLTPDEAAN